MYRQSNQTHKLFFFFMNTATTEIYTLSLHDALPIFRHRLACARNASRVDQEEPAALHGHHERSEEHTSELQSRPHLVCRLLLEKKKTVSLQKRHAFCAPKLFAASGKCSSAYQVSNAA